MREVRAPGVYFEPSEQRIAPLELGETGVPVFLGITRRGPLDRPVRLTSEARFVELFGEPLPDGYLGPALRGFFDNGGEDCYVLRVARMEGAPGESFAATAKHTLLDRGGQPTLRITALDPGSWGNHVRVTLALSSPNRTFLTLDGDPGDEAVHVKSTHGLTPGTLVRIHDAQNEQWTVVRSVAGKRLILADPLARAFASAAPTYVVAHTFDLKVRDLEREERFGELSLFGNSARFVERVINEQSRLIRCTALRPSTPVELAEPIEVAEVSLSGGADGLTDLGPEDFIGHDRGPGDRRGLMSLVEYDEIDLVAMPDLMNAFERSTRFTLRGVEAVQEAAVTICERAINRFALLDMPPGADFEEALRWRRQIDSPRAALYFPWVVVLRGGKRVTVPPCGHVAGIIARSDRAIGVHKAPANEIVEGIVDLDVLLRDTHLALLNDAGINCMRPFGPRGLRLWGARTTSSDPEWRYINVRRTVSAIAAAIEAGMQWVVFETNNPDLWKRVARQISAFLMGLRERGMLSGATPEEAFFVKCDGETNPGPEVDAGRLTTLIGLAVTRPVEFIVFRLSQRLEDEAQAVEE